jgi:hypothetical protein
MMFTFSFTLLFGVLAATDLTTSMWKPYVTIRRWPSTYSETLGFYASVVNVGNDRTTLVGHFDDNTKPTRTQTDSKGIVTITVGPSYYNVVNPVTGNGPDGTTTETWSGECTSSNQGAAIVCTEIVFGTGAFSSICSRKAYTGEASKSSFQFVSGYPLFCFNDTTVPPEYLATKLTVGVSSMTTFSNKVLITAGAEKLSATPGVKATGGAGPMKTSTPLLAGLGAAMAVFVL